MLLMWVKSHFPGNHHIGESIGRAKLSMTSAVGLISHDLSWESLATPQQEIPTASAEPLSNKEIGLNNHIKYQVPK